MFGLALCLKVSLFITCCTSAICCLQLGLCGLQKDVLAYKQMGDALSLLCMWHYDVEVLEEKSENRPVFYLSRLFFPCLIFFA